MCQLSVYQADSNSFDQLTGLWQVCFPDDPPEYPQKFLSALPTEAIALVGKADDVPVTMLFLLPAQAIFRDSVFPVRYLYAGCTHPLHRAKGYYRLLMTEAERTVREMGEYAIYLHPADEALVDTYCRMGYRVGIAGAGSSNAQKWQKDINYKQVRRDILINVSQNSVVWEMSSNVVDFFIDDAFSGGAAAFVGEGVAELKIADKTIEQVASKRPIDNDAFCLWLPTKNSPLEDVMSKHGGYTGIIGD